MAGELNTVQSFASHKLVGRTKIIKKYTRQELQNHLYNWIKLTDKGVERTWIKRDIKIN